MINSDSSGVVIILLIIGVVIWFMIFELVLVFYKIGSRLVIIIVMVIVFGCMCSIVFWYSVLLSLLMLKVCGFFSDGFVLMVWCRYISIIMLNFVVILVRVIKLVLVVIDRWNFI